MARPLSPAAILQALDAASYYEILGVPESAGLDWIQDAFRKFALEYHPDRYVRESREMRQVVARVFKRGAEAFQVLGDPALRPLYDEGLTRGALRYDATEAAAAAEQASPMGQSFESIAATPKARELAMRADRLLLAGKIEEARLLLTDAAQDDFENAELRRRLDALYTAQGFEELRDHGRKPAATAEEPASGVPRSLESIATTAKARELARRADRLLAVGKTEEARVLLTDAVQDDFENAELRRRLEALYTAEGFEVLAAFDGSIER